MFAWLLAWLQTAGRGANEGRNRIAKDTSPSKKGENKKRKTPQPETPKVYALAAELRLILHRSLDRHQMVICLNC